MDVWVCWVVILSNSLCKQVGDIPSYIYIAVSWRHVWYLVSIPLYIMHCNCQRDLYRLPSVPQPLGGRVLPLYETLLSTSLCTVKRTTYQGLEWITGTDCIVCSTTWQHISQLLILKGARDAIMWYNLHVPYCSAESSQNCWYMAWSGSPHKDAP